MDPLSTGGNAGSFSGSGSSSTSDISYRVLIVNVSDNRIYWFLPNVAACHAMANLLMEKHNTFWQDYHVVVAAGASAGIGLETLPPVRKAIGSGFETKTITLSCGKLRIHLHFVAP